MPIQPIALRAASHTVAPLQTDPKLRPAEFTRSRNAEAQDAIPVDGDRRTAMHRLRGISSPVREAVLGGGRHGDYQQIENRLRADPCAVKVCSRFHKNTLLHEACLHWTGHPDQQFLIGVLIKHGVDVNAKNSRGETALDIALKKLGPGQGATMQARAVEQLLRHHANVTPGILRKSEEMARRGDSWLREAIADRHPIRVRL